MFNEKKRKIYHGNPKLTRENPYQPINYTIRNDLIVICKMTVI